MSSVFTHKVFPHISFGW